MTSETSSCSLSPRTREEIGLVRGTQNPERELCKSVSGLLDEIFQNGKVTLFDLWVGPTSTLFFLAQGLERDSIVLVNGDDLLDRFANILKAKYKGAAEMDKSDKKELAKKGKKAFVAMEKKDIKEAQKSKKGKK